MNNIEEALERWCSGEGIRFDSQEAKEQYQKRAGRIADVILLRTPDRLPVYLSLGIFPAQDNGYTCEEVFFDFKKARKAWMKTILEFEPDMANGASDAVLPGRVLELLGSSDFYLPGRGIPATSNFQIVDREWCTAEEFYDPFIKNPTEFIQQTYMKRIFKVMEDVEWLPSGLPLMGGSYGAAFWAAPFGMPQLQKAIEIISSAGEEALKWFGQVTEENNELHAKGFPGTGILSPGAPFDSIGNFFRGTRGVMLDIHRYPEKLHEAMEVFVEITVNQAIKSNARSVSPIIPMYLHKGADNFMSLKHFEVFYWPYLREILVKLIDHGLVPMPFFEANYQSRLHTIKDIPEKSAIYRFQYMDMAQARTILGDTVCLMGNVPMSLLCSGSPDSIKDSIKTLVDTAGKDGGLIIAPGASLDNPIKENLRVFVDFAKEYGICH